MQPILSTLTMRNSDKSTINNGTPSIELINRAAREIYNAVTEKHGWDSTVAIVCGSGNNASDGYALALLLIEFKISVHIILTSNRFSDEGKYLFEKCKELGIKYYNSDSAFHFEGYNIIVDCIYGTGFHGEIINPVTNIIKAINSAQALGTYVVSVDINSGLNGDNGMANLCVKSDLTISVGYFQPGHFLNMAKDYINEKINYPIGISPIEKSYELWEIDDVKRMYPPRKNFSNKGTYGYITLIGGSLRYSGAIKLASMADAAMRSGAGVTTIAVPREIVSYIAPHILEPTIFPLSDTNGELSFCESEFRELIKNRRAIAFGMGIGSSIDVKRALEFLLEQYDGTLIIDADGLNCLSSINEKLILNTKSKLILTPHIKEFSRLSGKTVSEIQQNPIDEAIKYANSHKLILLLKGPSTIVTDGQRVLLVDRGCAGMATAGSGDVLSGITAAVCGSNTDKLLESVASAAWINGRAGEIAQYKRDSISMIASDTVNNIVSAIAELI